MTRCITRISRLVFTTVNDWLCFPLGIRTFACHVVIYSNLLPPMLVSPLLIYMYSPFELRYVAADLCIHPLSCVMSHVIRGKALTRESNSYMGLCFSH